MKFYMRKIGNKSTMVHYLRVVGNMEA